MFWPLFSAFFRRGWSWLVGLGLGGLGGLGLGLVRVRVRQVLYSYIHVWGFPLLSGSWPQYKQTSQQIQKVKKVTDRNHVRVCTIFLIPHHLVGHFL